MLVEDENLILSVDESWSNDHAMGLRGWITSKKGALDKVEISVGGNTILITSWHPRPDVEAVYPLYYTQNCGFVVHFPRIAKHQVTFNAKGQGKTYNTTITCDGSFPQPPDPHLFPDGSSLYNQFMQLVNQNYLNVLEIGSRIVSPGSVSQRSLFPNAQSYTGFDYYPDSNTDVVGDAHKLSQYFNNQRFDGIFSLSVLEHLAMPWIVAREISKILEVGGYTFHHTHFTWPTHELPWDFWRFCDTGLKALFSPALGFEVIQAAYHEPMRLHFDRLQSGQESFPTYPVFGGVVILAKKVREVNYDKFRWDVTLDDILEPESYYPKPQP
ncbi:methyltransferase domain-containing protein [Planktothrix rubescens]|uniref:methyltransferase domain-containing protein n=1 Tax=Planktothrix rubescens TaxID=59512 RepID=UPI00040CD969|nr:methyltransferase domain-containing protein [Planktothrix rubescens]